MLGNEVLPQPYRFINKLVQRCVDLALEDIVKNLTRGAVIDKKYLPSTMTPVYDLNTDAFSPANDDRLHTITNVVSVYGNHILNTQSPTASSQHHPDAGSNSLLLGASSQGRGISDAFGYVGGGSTSSPNARPPSGNAAQHSSSAQEGGGGGAEQLLANSMSTQGGGVNNAAVFAALASNMRGKSPLADLLAAQHSAQLAKERKAALQLPMPQAKNITATHMGPQFTIVGTQAGTCAIFETRANEHILTTPILLNPDPCYGDAGPLLARIAESASLGGGEMNSNTHTMVTGAATTAGGASAASGGSGLNLARAMSKNNMKQQVQAPTQGVGLPSNNVTASPAGSLPSSPPSGKRGGITSAHRGASAQNSATAATTPQSLLSTLPEGVVGVHGGTPLHPQGLRLFAAASATDGIVVFAADSDRISVQPTIPPPRPLPPPELFAFPPGTPNTSSNAAGSTPLAGERGGGKPGGGLPRSGGRTGSASPVPQSSSSAARASTPVRNVASPTPAPNEQYQQHISKHMGTATPPPRALYTPLATGLNAEPKEPANLHIVCKINGLLIASLAADHLKSLGYQGVPSTVNAYSSNLFVGGSSAGAANMSPSPARRAGRNGSGGSSGALGLGNAPGATSAQNNGNNTLGKGGASSVNPTLQTASALSAKEKGLSSGGSSNNMSAAAAAANSSGSANTADSSAPYDNSWGAELLDDPFYSPANASSPAALSRVANAAVPLSRTAFVPSSVKLSPDGTFITVGVDNDSTLLVFDISEEPVDPYLADTVVRVPKYLAAISCPSSLAGPSVADGSMLRPKALYEFLCDAKGYHLKAGVTEAATAAVVALGGGEGILGDGVVGGMGGGCGASTRSGGFSSRSTLRPAGVSTSERHRVPHQHGVTQNGALLEEAEGGPPLLPVNTRAPLPSYTHSLAVAWAGSNAFSRVNLRDDGITSVPQGVLASVGVGLAAEGGRPFLITTVNASNLQTFPPYSSNNSIDGAAPAPPTSFTAFSKSNVKVTSQQWSQTLNAMHGPLIAAYTLAARTAGAVASSSAAGGAGAVGTSHGSKGGGAGGGGGGQRATGGSIVGGLGASVGRETAAGKEAAAAAAAATAQLLGAVTHLSMGATQYGNNGYSSHIAHHVAGLAGIGLGAHVSSLVFGGGLGVSSTSPGPSAVSIGGGGGGTTLPRSSTTILTTATNNGTAGTALVSPFSTSVHQQQHQQHIFAPIPPSAQKDQLLPQIVTTTAIDPSHRLFAVCCQNALTMVFDGETLRFRYYFCDAPHRIHQRSSRQMSCLSAVFQNQDTLTIATVSHGKAYRSFVSVYALNPDAAIRIQPDLIANMRRGEGDAEAASSFNHTQNNNTTNSNLYINSESKSRHLRSNTNKNSKRNRKSSPSAYSSSSDTSSEGDGGEGNKTPKRGLTGLSNTVVSRLDMTSRTKIDAAILAKMPGPLEEMLAAFDETRKRNATEEAKSRTRGVHGLRSGVSEEERHRLAAVREAMHSNCSMASVNTTALVSSSASPGSALGMYSPFDDDEDSYGAARGLSSLRNHSSLSFVAPAGGAVGKKAANLLIDSYNGELICKVPYLNDLVFAAPIGDFPVLLVRASGRQFIIDMTCGELLGILKDVGRNVFNGKNTPASVYTAAANAFYSNGDGLSKSTVASSNNGAATSPSALPPAAYLASLLNTEASLLNGTFLTTYAASIGDGSSSGAQQGGAGSVGGVRRGASGGAPNRTALAGAAVARRSGSTSQLGTARGTAPPAASASLGLSMSAGRTVSVLSSRGSQRGTGGEGKNGGGGSFSAPTTTPLPQHHHGNASLGGLDNQLLGASRGSILYAGSEGSSQGPIGVANMAQNCTAALSMISATASSASALKLFAPQPSSQTSTSQPSPVAFVSASSFAASAAYNHQHYNSSSSPSIPLSPDAIRRAMCEGPFTLANPKPSTVAFTVKLAASVPRVVLTDSELVVSCDGGWSVQRYPMLPLLWRLYPNLQASFSPPSSASALPSSTVSPMVSALSSSTGRNLALRIPPFVTNAASQPSIAITGPSTALGAKAAGQRQPPSASTPPPPLLVSDAAAKAAAASFTPPSHFGLSATNPEALALALFYFSHAARIDLIDDYVTADVDKFVASRLGVPPSQVQFALSVANRDHPDKALAHHLASSLLGRSKSPYSTTSASTRGASTTLNSKLRTRKENGSIPTLAQSNVMGSVIEPRATTSGTVGAHQQHAGAGANVSWASHSPTRSHAGASSHSPLPPLTTALGQALPNVTTKFSELAQQGVDARKKSRGAREARVANAWRTLQNMSASASVSATTAAVERSSKGTKGAK